MTFVLAMNKLEKKYVNSLHLECDDQARYHYLHEVRQQSPEWFQARRYRVTASDVATVCNVENAKCVSSLLRYKLTGKTLQWNSRGLKTEGAGAELYSQILKRSDSAITSYSVDKVGLCVSSSIPYLSCSPDRLVTINHKRKEKQTGILEIKHRKYIPQTIAEDTKYQAVASLFISGLDFVHVFTWHSGRGARGFDDVGKLSPDKRNRYTLVKYQADNPNVIKLWEETMLPKIRMWYLMYYGEIATHDFRDHLGVQSPPLSNEHSQYDRNNSHSSNESGQHDESLNVVVSQAQTLKAECSRNNKRHGSHKGPEASQIILVDDGVVFEGTSGSQPLPDELEMSFSWINQPGILRVVAQLQQDLSSCQRLLCASNSDVEKGSQRLLRCIGMVYTNESWSLHPTKYDEYARAKNVRECIDNNELQDYLVDIAYTRGYGYCTDVLAASLGVLWKQMAPMMLNSSKDDMRELRPLVWVMMGIIVCVSCIDVQNTTRGTLVDCLFDQVTIDLHDSVLDSKESEILIQNYAYFLQYFVDQRIIDDSVVQCVLSDWPTQHLPEQERLSKLLQSYLKKEQQESEDACSQ